ncbi:MAG: helix-turn-helix domain-containing protein, partial [Acidobacteriota bacterium]
DLLLQWTWPGNVRELQNVVERALVLARGSRIEPEDLPEEVRRLQAAEVPSGSQRLADIERRHIERVLEDAGGNRTRAAAILGIGPATLFRKLKAYAQPEA